MQGGLGIAVGSLFIRPALALPEPAIVEREDIHAQFQPCLIKVQPVADVPAVPVTEQDRERALGCGRMNEPAMDFPVVPGGEQDLL